MDSNNYTDGGYTEMQVGRFAGPDETRDRGDETDGTEVRVENVRSGNARVGFEADRVHIDGLNIQFGQR